MIFSNDVRYEINVNKWKVMDWVKKYSLPHTQWWSLNSLLLLLLHLRAILKSMRTSVKCCCVFCKKKKKWQSRNYWENYEEFKTWDSCENLLYASIWTTTWIGVIYFWKNLIELERAQRRVTRMSYTTEWFLYKQRLRRWVFFSLGEIWLRESGKTCKKPK